MAGYLARRLLQSAVTVWLVVTIVFIMLHLMPGSTARAVLGQRAYPAEIAAFDRLNGLDLPWPAQYARFLTALATRGQLTFAAPAPHSMYQVINGYAQGASLLQLLTGPVANTALLVGIALAVSVPAGMALGAWLAYRSGPRWLIAAVGMAGQVGYALPVFVTGLVLVQLLSFDTGVLPFNNPQWALGDVISRPAGLVLPVLTLVIANVALFARYFQASVAETVLSDYVTTARGKGASEWRILRHHVARNAAIPVVTVLAARIPTILSIEIPLEAFFHYPGIGNLAWIAATGKLSYILLGAVLIVSVIVVIATLAADILYLALDPRIRYAAHAV